MKSKNGLQVVDIVLQSQLSQQEKMENILILVQNNPHISPEQLIKYVKYLNDIKQSSENDIKMYADKQQLHPSFQALYKVAEETLKVIEDTKDKLNNIKEINLKEIEKIINKSKCGDCIIT